MNDLLIGILVCWALIGGFAGGFLQMIFACAEENELSFKMAFWFAIMFYESNKDRLNAAGLTIVIIVMSLFLLPGSVLILFIMCLCKACHKLWEVYKYVFRKV